MAKRKDRKQRQEVCECDATLDLRLSHQQEAVSSLPSGSSSTDETWLVPCDVPTSFSQEEKTTKSLPLFSVGQTVNSSGRFSKLPDLYLEALPSEDGRHNLKGSKNKRGGVWGESPQVTSMLALLQDQSAL